MVRLRRASARQYANSENNATYSCSQDVHRAAEHLQNAQFFVLCMTSTLHGFDPNT